MKCLSGNHEWSDPEDAARCCNGYNRIGCNSRRELEQYGCEHITARGDNAGWYDGWKRNPTLPSTRDFCITEPTQ